MSNKKNLSAEETDLTRRKLLTSAGILGRAVCYPAR
ncbi:sulfatase [Salmonella enterica subsp. enterica serovar Cerro str. FSL R8-0235]|nr:sulfatase [Salmonella enterica subsp. enterica serovar Cerro str. FSL R8-0235]